LLVADDKAKAPELCAFDKTHDANHDTEQRKNLGDFPSN
jgi:hypothetical protein